MTHTPTISREREDLCARFSEKAQAVSAVVQTLKDFDAAVNYIAELYSRPQASGIANSGSKDNSLTDQPEGILLAAPNLEAHQYETLENICNKNGITCIQTGLRSHLEGIDIGFTIADLAIAETGTLVLNCPGEDLRLATMISDCHVCIVRKEHIVGDAFAAERQLLKFMHKTPNYTALITGASRTADIERVLALGVHGPLELHILLMED